MTCNIKVGETLSSSSLLSRCQPSGKAWAAHTLEAAWPQKWGRINMCTRGSYHESGVKIQIQDDKVQTSSIQAHFMMKSGSFGVCEYIPSSTLAGWKLRRRGAAGCMIHQHLMHSTMLGSWAREDAMKSIECSIDLNSTRSSIKSSLYTTPFLSCHPNPSSTSTTSPVALCSNERLVTWS